VKFAHLYTNVARIHGATKVLLMFSTYLEKAGHQSVIVCNSFTLSPPFWFQGEIKTLFKGNQEVTEKSGLRKLIYILGQVIWAIFLPIKIPRDVDCIVIHGEGSQYAMPVVKIFFFRKPLIYYCYQPPRELYDLKDFSKEAYGLWYSIFSPLFALHKWLHRIIVRMSWAILGWSDYTNQYAQKIYGPHHYHVVPAGIDFEPFEKEWRNPKKSQALKNSLGLKTETVLLMNASLTLKKNIPILFNAMALLQEKGFEIHGLIIGEGPEENNLLCLAEELDILKKVTLLGYVSQEDLPLYYFISDILCFLEPRGLWTMSVPEAGAARKPVIAEGGGSLPTLVQDGKTGFLLTEGNRAEMLAEKVEWLIHHPVEAKAMGEANYRHVQKFSEPLCIQSFLNIFKLS